MKKLRKKDMYGNLENYIPDNFDNSLVYVPKTNRKGIKNDIMVKWIITKSLGGKDQRDSKKPQ